MPLGRRRRVACRLQPGLPMTARAQARPPSELAQLVAAEARFDRALEGARAEATALVDAARRRASAADAMLTDEIAGQRARIAADIVVEVATQRTAIVEAARAEIARYQAVCGDVSVAIARLLAAKLGALARAEASSS